MIIVLATLLSLFLHFYTRPLVEISPSRVIPKLRPPSINSKVFASGGCTCSHSRLSNLIHGTNLVPHHSRSSVTQDEYNPRTERYVNTFHPLCPYHAWLAYYSADLYIVRFPFVTFIPQTYY